MSKSKKQATSKWWSDWTILWVFGGFAVAYFVFIPLEMHPRHWLLSVLGGVVGYGIGLFFDIGFPSVVRFVRHSSRRVTLKHDGGKTSGKEKISDNYRDRPYFD